MSRNEQTGGEHDESEPDSLAARSRAQFRSLFDGLALAWALVFAILYARMVLEERGGKLLGLIRRVSGLGE